MLRLLFALAITAGWCLGVSAQDAPEKAKPEVTLKVGDLAPKLKVTKWLKGEPVMSFEPGKVYVVEFWATWCGPCISAMPHVSELQEEYRDKGLTVIGLTSRDERGNTEQKVIDFVKDRGENIMRYTVAWCEDRATNDAFMKAAGQGGIPCSFVIDQKGAIAYIGHPLILDEVLPKVIGGTWNGKADAETASKSLDAFFKMLGGANRQPEEGLKQLAEFEKSNPKLAGQFGDMKMMLQLRSKKVDEAEQTFSEVMASSIKKKDAAKLTSISRMWTTPQFNPDKKNPKLAVDAVEAAQKLAAKDFTTYLAAAQVYSAVGDKAKAATAADKAVEMAPEEYKERVKSMMEQYKK